MMDQDLSSKLDRTLEKYFDEDIFFIIRIFKEVLEENLWSRKGIISDLVKKRFRSMGLNQLNFVVNIQKFTISIQEYFLFSSLYTEAFFKMISSGNDDVQKPYTLSHFIESLIKRKVVFWEPGKFHCLCCLFSSKGPEGFAAYMEARHDRYTLEKVLLLNQGRSKKILKPLLKDKKLYDSHSEAFLLLESFFKKGVLHINSEYADLPNSLESIDLVLNIREIEYDIFLDFLGSMISNLHYSMMVKISSYNRLDCLTKACINTYDTNYRYYMEKFQGSPHHSEESPCSKSKKSKSSKKSSAKITENKLLKADEKLESKGRNHIEKLPDTEKVSIALACRVNDLKSKFESIGTKLKINKSSAEGWIAQTKKFISEVKCSLHGSEGCEICQEMTPEEKIVRFNDRLEKKRDQIRALEDRLETCYLCASKEEHESSLAYFSEKQDLKSKEIEGHVKLSEDGLQRYEKAVDSFISCCEEVDGLHKETVPNLCSFHQQWKRILTSEKKDWPSKKISHKGNTHGVNRKERGLSFLHKKTIELDKEFKDMLDMISSQSEKLEMISSISSELNDFPDSNKIKVKKEKIIKIHEEIVSESDAESKKLEHLLKQDFLIITQHIANEIDLAYSRLLDIKEKYGVFLNSCDGLEKTFEEIIRAKKDKLFDEVIPKGLKIQAVPGDGHCLFYAVGLYSGHSAYTLRNMVAEKMRECAEDFIGHFPGTEESFYRHIEMVRNSNEWGDAIEIEALQRCLKRPIVIVKEDGVTVPSNVSDFKNPPVFVFYDGMHYDALLISPGYEPKQILLDILDKQKSVSEKSSEPERCTSCCEFHTNLLASNRRALADPLYDKASINEESSENEIMSYDLILKYLPSFLVEELELDADAIEADDPKSCVSRLFAAQPVSNTLYIQAQQKQNNSDYDVIVSKTAAISKYS